MDQKDCYVKNICNKIDCDKFCIRFNRLNTLFDNALLTDNQKLHIDLKLDKDECDRAVFDNLKKYELNIDSVVKSGTNILLWSVITGNGKTSWAIRLLQAYFINSWYKTNKDCLGLFISVPRYLLALKDNIIDKSDYIKHIKDNVLTCDIVIWDDIATKAATVFEHENLLSIIDARIAAGKVNIYTSNLSPEELHIALGDRLYSRVVQGSKQFNLIGKDKRILKVCE